MKSILKSCLLISLFSLAAMEQKVIKLTTTCENSFFKIFAYRNVSNERRRGLCFRDEAKSSDPFDASRGPVYWFRAEGLESAEGTIEQDRVYLRLIFKNRINCWLRDKGEKSFSLIKTIAVGQADKHIAISDDENYIIKHFWRSGKRIFNLYRAGGCLVSSCELLGSYTAKGRWIFFDATNTRYAVHLANNYWYIINCATGTVEGTLWSANQINFAALVR